MRLPFVLPVLGTLTAPVLAADCTREGLLAAAHSYVAAQAAGDISKLLPLDSTNFTYRKNNKAAALAPGVLATPLKLDLNRSTADAVACASYTLLISTTGGGSRSTKPYVLATQIRHRGNDTSAMATIDTIAATTGSLFFNAAQTLRYLQAEEDWSSSPPPVDPSSAAAAAAAARPTDRATLRKFADAYLDMWTDAKAADQMAWAPGCERVEGSRLTRPCNGSLPRGGSAQRNGDRRYVIDDVYGSVDVLCEFSSLGDMPDSHELRVVNGKVKYVHTVTV